jgi:hypothetical protein
VTVSWFSLYPQLALLAFPPRLAMGDCFVPRSDISQLIGKDFSESLLWQLGCPMALLGIERLSM